MKNTTGSPVSNLPGIDDNTYNDFMDEVIARGGPRFNKAIEEYLTRREEEQRQAQYQQEMEKRQARHDGWLENHYGNLSKAFEADPEFKDLLQQRKMTEGDFRGLYESMLPYKDHAPSVLKKVLRDENVLNDFRKSPDDLDKNYLLNNVFADVTRDMQAQQNQQPNQQQAQQPGAGQPVKLPNPQLMPEMPSANSLDDEIADSISRM